VPPEGRLAPGTGRGERRRSRGKKRGKRGKAPSGRRLQTTLVSGGWGGREEGKGPRPSEKPFGDVRGKGGGRRGMKLLGRGKKRHKLRKKKS